MQYHELDRIFPYVIFCYGLIMTFILNSEFFLKLAEEKLPRPLYLNFMSHRLMGFICLIVGGLWSLQNLWITGP
jgi:hypothetical protein